MFNEEKIETEKQVKTDLSLEEIKAVSGGEEFQLFSVSCAGHLVG